MDDKKPKMSTTLITAQTFLYSKNKFMVRYASELIMLKMRLTKDIYEHEPTELYRNIDQ